MQWKLFCLMKMMNDTDDIDIETTTMENFHRTANWIAELNSGIDSRIDCKIDSGMNSDFESD